VPARVSVGPVSGDDDLRALTEVLNRTYLRSPDEGQLWLKRVRAEHLRVVRRGSRVAGGLSLLPMGQWFGGRSVSMTGVASVAIDPEHRSTGLAGSLMREVLEELHESGVALSMLYPATQPVYRRAGWELAGTWTRRRIPASAIDVRDRDLPMLRLDPGPLQDLRELYGRRARWATGYLDRSADLWENRILRPRDEEDVHVYAAGDQGYVVFVQNRNGGWKYDLVARDLVALTSAAARRLLSFVADHRSFAKNLVWTSSDGDPICMQLREQEWEQDRSWQWMLRVVDVRGALAARGYPPPIEAEVHFDVRDNVLPWNEGRVVLEVAGGKGKVRKGGRGRVRIDVRGLASLYSGFMGAESLAATGYLEGSERDLATASAVFAGPAPSSADFF
jgi:predicted acetyltransferase